MNEGGTVLDLRGLKCPLPVLRTARALEKLPGGALLQVLCTDPMSALDIPHLLFERGDQLVAAAEENGTHIFNIRKT